MFADRRFIKLFCESFGLRPSCPEEAAPVLHVYSAIAICMSHRVYGRFYFPPQKHILQPNLIRSHDRFAVADDSHVQCLAFRLLREIWCRVLGGAPLCLWRELAFFQQLVDLFGS